MNNKYRPLIVVADGLPDDPKTEWGVSFTSHNPELEDYVACKTQLDAFKLKAKVDSIIAAYAASEGRT